ncbi:hypothetical protein MNB_ARC-1_28 [hydrothermal vent metagenome]|uniref:Oxaloacetate decarboxylase gamma chain n=1 Tax=hydrothermal vent metagenome TaxID=652676 RepID=A0A3B1E5Q3_9ZZZZ
MEVNLVGEALKFMVLGMGIVFAFLIIMIFALKTQTVLVGKYFKEEVNDSSTSNEWHPSLEDNKDVIAAITAAIFQYNQKNKQ